MILKYPEEKDAIGAEYNKISLTHESNVETRKPIKKYRLISLIYKFTIYHVLLICRKSGNEIKSWKADHILQLLQPNYTFIFAKKNMKLLINKIISIILFEYLK
jgi:hypothetical protein